MTGGTEHFQGREAGCARGRRPSGNRAVCLQHHAIVSSTAPASTVTEGHTLFPDGPRTTPSTPSKVGGGHSRIPRHAMMQVETRAPPPAFTALGPTNRCGSWIWMSQRHRPSRGRGGAEDAGDVSRRRPFGLRMFSRPIACGGPGRQDLPCPARQVRNRGRPRRPWRRCRLRIRHPWGHRSTR